MKKIGFGQKISILANVGVIAGIVFLAIEVRQNQETLEEQNTLAMLSARDAAFDTYSAARTRMLENPELYEVWEKGRNGELLTAIEGEQFATLRIDFIFREVSLYNKFSTLGLRGEAEVTVRRVARTISESRVMKDYWENIKRNIEARGYGDFVREVDTAYHSYLESPESDGSS